MSWQVFTAISVVSLSLSVLLQRILLHKDKLDPYAYAVTFQFIVGVLLCGFALVRGFELPGIEKVIVPAIIALVAFGSGHILYAKTLQLVEASAFSVLFATQAIWIMLLGIMLFHESLTLLQVFGAVLILGSVGMLLKNWRSLKLDRGTALGLMTGVLFGIAITSWSYVGRHTEPVSWAAISFICTALVALAIKPSTVRKLGSVLHGTLLLRLGALAIVYGLGSLTMLYAYREGTFSVVTPIRQTSIIVTTLLALIVFTSERNRIAVKMSAAVLSFIGVLLIVL